MIVGFAGCRTFSPTPMERVPFRERAQSQSRNGITVTVAVLSADEALAIFDVRFSKRKIQPVWIKIGNATGQTLAFLPAAVHRSDRQ